MSNLRNYREIWESLAWACHPFKKTMTSDIQRTIRINPIIVLGRESWRRQCSWPQRTKTQGCICFLGHLTRNSSNNIGRTFRPVALNFALKIHLSFFRKGKGKGKERKGKRRGEEREGRERRDETKRDEMRLEETRSGEARGRGKKIPMLKYLPQTSRVKISNCGSWDSVFYKIPSDSYI